ncbi:hypothetical protein MPNT_200055 [Candidatus Methylacidithermus pantelleriae]|uniref:Uncharacterized protein n=1 Tax=Candidatus Methylacidithermus pantelleriae TaxID=2744239 RepID=A0A8J2FPP0_9BACT|nr:hypothetical protein MPNT_200055 [Candidatus Methylacidithermus pantelleriae]
MTSKGSWQRGSVGLGPDFPSLPDLNRAFHRAREEASARGCQYLHYIWATRVFHEKIFP